MTSVRLNRIATAAAVLGPLAAGAALIPLRDRIDNTNIALLLVVTVVAVASLGRRPAAVVAALSAAVAFNVFHTRPYGSLRIESGDDVETALLLLAVGIAVGELALRGRRARVLVEESKHDLARIQGLGRLVVEGEDPDYVLLATASELTHLLHLVDCRYELGPTDPDGPVLAVVERDGTVKWGPTLWETDRWGMPRDGVTIPIWANGQRRGRFLLRGPIGLPYSLDVLSRAVGLVDQAGAALASRPAVA